MRPIHFAAGAAAVLGVGLAAAAVVGVVIALGAPAATPPGSESAPPEAAVVAPAPAPGQGETGDGEGISVLADPGWIATTAEAAGIPPRALAAYAGAALRVSHTDPSCGLGWNTLAAIGHVETEHGTIGGGRIDDDGVARPRIVGIALDGTRSARISDTDGGALDGDPEWDRAVGPMQFIPSTWESAGRDGDGDGRADIDQIDDAALSAAEYLCRSGRLATTAGWIAAVHAYNADADYNRRVAEAAAFYAGTG